MLCLFQDETATLDQLVIISIINLPLYIMFHIYTCVAWLCTLCATQVNIVMNSNDLQVISQPLQGLQMGEYYGFSLLAADLNGDK